MIRVCDLTPEQAPPGTRIRVGYVAQGPMEHQGLVRDRKRLMGATGTVERLNRVRTPEFRQLWVAWDDPATGRLVLASADAVEIIR